GDPLNFILDNYYMSDYQSAAMGIDPQLKAYAGKNNKLTLQERYELFLRAYRGSNQTAYARGMQIGLRECWGIRDVSSYEEFCALSEKLKSRGPEIYGRMMERYGVRAKVVDAFDIADLVDGSRSDYSEYCRFAYPLPSFHNIHSAGDVYRLQRYLDRTIVCLDDYLEAFDECLKRHIDFGVVCFKDQSAYRRTLAYGNPTRAEAEKAFCDIMMNQRDVFGDDHVRALDDWLFQYALRAAAKYDLPVQLHTGHMAGIRNEIQKTNAAQLIPTIELNRDVRFDLFHGNWPYMDEYLFMGKNYPNVWLNLCWVQAIDPLYSIELMKRAVMTVPHAKLFAFGGDTGFVEWMVGYLVLARDNVA
ncbi:MAG TPA: amidohydrolase family protein, partial [Clostridia bacterium]|nr:amidohydrolase family protein [Clostridia bacterium]